MSANFLLWIKKINFIILGEKKLVWNEFTLLTLLLWYVTAKLSSNNRTDTKHGVSAIFFAEQNFDVCLVWNTQQGQEWDFESDFRHFFLTFANNLFLNLKTETVLILPCKCNVKKINKLTKAWIWNHFSWKINHPFINFAKSVTLFTEYTEPETEMISVVQAGRTEMHWDAVRAGYFLCFQELE